MAFNIAVTSKYNPFTYEDYIKPLEQYTKDYKKQEETYDKALEDIALLDASIASLDADQEGNKAYIQQVNDYKNQIYNLTDQLATEGFGAQHRKASSKLRQAYNSQIVPISKALEELKRYQTAEREKENAGYIIGAGSMRDLTLDDVIGGNVPESTSMLSLKDLEDEVAAITTRITSAMVNYEGATEKEIQAGTRKGYKTTVAFDPRLLLQENFGGNQLALEAYDGIYNQSKKYLLAKLGLSEEEYQNLSAREREKVDATINQGIMRGVNYQQSITPRRVATGGGGVVRKPGDPDNKEYVVWVGGDNEEEIAALQTRVNTLKGKTGKIVEIGGIPIPDGNKGKELTFISKKAISTSKAGRMPVEVAYPDGTSKIIWVDAPGKAPKKKTDGKSLYQNFVNPGNYAQTPEDNSEETIPF